MRSTETTRESSSPANSVRASGRRPLSAVLIGGIICVGICLFSGGRNSALSVELGGTAVAFTVAASGAEPAQDGSKDFSKFSHNNASHQRLPCLLCHRRESNSAIPVRAVRHTPCAGCHAQQFEASSGPMCTICHTGVDGGSRGTKPFPSLKSFNMTFAHAQHQSVACSNCHKPANRGVAFSMPSGTNAHTTCYQCHTPRAQANGRDISTCGTCHKPGRHSRASISAKAFRVGFSHDQHRREGLNCLDCHRITNVSARSGQVTSPFPSQHSATSRVQSCETCHNNERAFGIASFSDCKRCHQGPTFRF